MLLPPRNIPTVCIYAITSPAVCQDYFCGLILTALYRKKAAATLFHKKWLPVCHGSNLAGHNFLLRQFLLQSVLPFFFLCFLWSSVQAVSFVNQLPVILTPTVAASPVPAQAVPPNPPPPSPPPCPVSWPPPCFPVCRQKTDSPPALTDTSASDTDRWPDPV